MTADDPRDRTRIDIPVLGEKVAPLPGMDSAVEAARRTRIPDYAAPARKMPPPGVQRAAAIPPMGIAGCACEPRSAEESIDDPQPHGPWDLDPKCIHHGHLWHDPESGESAIEVATRERHEHSPDCVCSGHAMGGNIIWKIQGCPVHGAPETSAEPQVRLDLADDAIAASAKNLTLQLLELAKQAAGEIAHAKTGDQTQGLLLAVQTSLTLATQADDLGDKSVVRAELAHELPPITRVVIERWLELLLSNDDDATQRLHDEIVVVLGSTP